jgi:hypothetical protein
VLRLLPQMAAAMEGAQAVLLVAIRANTSKPEFGQLLTEVRTQGGAEGWG